MAKLIFVLSMICICATAATQAQAAAPVEGSDAKASVSGQLYPPGGIVTGTIGYGKVLWRSGSDAPKDQQGNDQRGDQNNGQSKDQSDGGTSNFWKYGYVRPTLELKTTALTNRVSGAFEFYPISILGLSAGGGIDMRNYNSFSGIDCNRYLCNQSLTFHFTQAQLIAGAGKFAAIATGRYDWYRAQSADRPFYDYMSYLMGRNGSDDLRNLTLLMLYRHSETWAFGALAIYQQMVLSQSNNGSIFAITNYTEGPWQFSFGVGDYRSDHQALRPSALFLLSYTARQSIGLMH